MTSAEHLTVGNLEAEKSNEKECSDVGKVIALQVEIFGHAHDGRVL